MVQTTLFWHDYETFGTDPKRDKPAQFAGVRTDENFNQIGDPVCFYCKPPADYLPQPEACLITGITPQYALQHGLCEAEFAKAILHELAQPQTCTLGYNSLRFDDEVTRNLLYRNFYDPYAREWQLGNSRWDLIDVMRCAYALRPEGIVWPTTEEGRPSFRLEELTRVNGIAHEAAHDALSDVYATIAIAKLLQNAQPKLYQFLWESRLKPQVEQLLQLGSYQPLVHVSSKYPAQQSCLAVILPLCAHPTDKNGVIVYDLSVDPEPLLNLNAAAIKARLFTATADLPEGVERIPLKTVHVNRCPVLAPLKVIRPADVQRLGLDLARCTAHAAQISAAANLSVKIAEVFTVEEHSLLNEDPDWAIYSGGFFSAADRRLMQTVTALSPEKLAQSSFAFKDKRLVEMLFRYRARNYPDSLTTAEQQRWREFCIARLNTESEGLLTLAQYRERLEHLTGQGKDTLIAQLVDFALVKQSDLAS